MSSSPLWAVLLVFILCLVVFVYSPVYSSSFVLGKQYLLKQKRQNSSLVWYAVIFDRSITGGLKLTLKVYSEKGKTLEFLDDYRDYVADDIAERCISKFAMTDYNMEFDETRKGSLGFQVKSVSDVIYVPLKVRYEDGFEDYLVRIRIFNGKFAISTRPLQQGMLIIPDENAVENYRAEQQKQKEDLAKKEQQKKAKQEEDLRLAEEQKKLEEEQKKQKAPKVFINEELFDPSSASMEELLKESEAQSKLKEEKAKSIVSPEEMDKALNPTAPMNSNFTNPSDGDVQDSKAIDEILNEPRESKSMVVPLKPSDPGFEKLESFDQPISPLKTDSSSGEPSESKIEDNEIQLDGFEEALKEIERLEQLEKDKDQTQP